MDIIKDELYKIQEDYLKLLKESKDIIDSDWLSVVDNINKFWYKHKKIIKTALNNWFIPYETYIFTAACILDYKDKEHLPFLLYGNQHIFDDPICRYAQSSMAGKGSAFSVTLNEKIKDLIEDNILILENLNKSVLILPVSYLSNDEKIDLVKSCDNAFLSLFDKQMTIQEYFEQIKTCNDLENLINEDLLKKLPFDTKDNFELSLKERIELHKKNNTYLPKEANDAEIFYIIVYGHISQAMNVIFICMSYEFIPYLRYDVAFNYFTHLISNFRDVDNIKTMIDKAGLSYFTKKIFDKSKVNITDIKDYKKKCSKFSQNVIKEVFINSVLKPNINIKNLEEIITKNLDNVIYK